MTKFNYSKTKRAIKKNLSNARGWRTNRKIVVISSDDWGALGVPSKKTYNNLLRKGIRVDKSVWDSKDFLANKEDIEFLCEILLRYQRGNSKPIFTFNTVMGNPDFDKIRENRFNKYSHEHFFKSYKKYTGDDLKPIWFEALKEGLIKPQFHAREHLNTSLWMWALNNNHKETKIAFDHNFYSLKTNIPSNYQRHYRAAYHPISEKDFEHKVDITKEGLDLFKKAFGFYSTSFVACQYVWPFELENELSEMNIKVIQGGWRHKCPNIYNGKKKLKRRYLGQKNNDRQIYFVRNCLFEPAVNSESMGVKACLTDIKAAFRWRKPAIICSHRINYVSGMDKKNRDRNLKRLDRLLSRIISLWPDVEFMSTDQLGKLILNEAQNNS